jgi:hypothetical protein
VNDVERSSKPLLHANSRLPLEQLSPEGFEQFVAGVLGILGPRLPTGDSFAAVQKSSGPTDDGFDLQARRCSDGELVCIQCKHLRSEPLSLDVVARELVKVALHCADKRLHVVKHLFVTTAKLTKSVETALREPDRRVLHEEALRVLGNPKDLAVRRQRVEAIGLSPEVVVKRYIQQVEIRAWSGEQLFIQCQVVWSQLTDVIERHFAITTVLREHPRPDFDEPRYLQRCGRTRDGQLVARKGRARTHPPFHIRSASMANPLARATLPAPLAAGGGAAQRPSLLKDLLETPEHHCALLTGTGGAGKTTLLQQVLAEAAHQRGADPEKPLPVLVELDRYRGQLGELIGSALGIRHGHWDSLPGSFLLLCDGLNEVPPDQLRPLAGELQDLLSRFPVSLVLSVRAEGMRRPMLLPRIDRIFELVPFSLQDISELAAAQLAPAACKVFLETVRMRMDTEELRMLELPFGLATALKLFRDKGALPRTESELFDLVLEHRFQRNQELTGWLAEPLPDIPHATVRALAESLAYELRCVRQEGTQRLESLGAILTQVISRLRETHAPGIEELGPLKAQQLLQHYELLVVTGEWARFPHDLMLDFLASRPLARTWRERASLLQSPACDEAWILASPLIPAADREAYLRVVAEADLVLAASCGRAMGMDGILRAEGEVLRRLEGKDTLYSWAQKANAMAVLRTELCLGMLRSVAAGPPSVFGGQAEQALIAAGYEPLAEGALEMAEFATASQDIPASAMLERWEEALPSAALRVARRRLETWDGQGPVRIAIRTLGWYGDVSDAPAVEKVLGITRDPRTARMAFRILYRLSSPAALQKLREVLPSHPPGTQFLLREVLSEEAGETDVNWLVDFVLSHPTELARTSEQRFSERDISRLQDRALRQLRQIPLPSEALQRCAMALWSAEQDRWRFRLWLLAPLLRPETVAPHLLKAMPTCSTDELGVIAGIIHEHLPVAAPERAELLRELHLRLDLEQGRHLDRGTQKALALCLLHADPETRVAALAFQFMRFLRDYAQAPAIPQKALSATSGKPGVAVVSRESMYAVLTGLLSLAVRFRESLPPALIVELLAIDATALSEKDRRMLGLLLLQAPDTALDERLEVIPELPVRLCFLSLLGKRELSSRRRKLLESDLAAALSHPVAVGYLRALVVQHWDEPLARLLVAEVASAQWEPDYLPADLFEGIDERFDRVLAEAVIAPVLNLHTHSHAQALLRYWYDCATQRRS